ncbi:hypothetical protein AB0I72_19115 [Nocardiopsis sp. NPDC049922]|uniref:hypothetical protein n=1 Tax=Nocardiopsis sp. NPDC049922 TaxID=3155157 RepID=UPI0033FAE89D
MPVIDIIRRVGAALVTNYDRLRHLARYRRNPALYVAVGAVLALVAVKLVDGDVTWQEALTEDFVTYLIVLAGGVLTRLQVWAPETVEDLEAAHEAEALDHYDVGFDPALLAPEADGGEG